MRKPIHFPYNRVHHSMGISWSYPYFGQGIGTNFPGSPDRMGFITFSQAKENWWKWSKFCNNYTETSNFFENIYIVSLLNWIPNDIDSEYEISNKLMQILSKRFVNWGTVTKIFHQVNSMSISALQIQSSNKLENNNVK